MKRQLAKFIVPAAFLGALVMPVAAQAQTNGSFRHPHSVHARLHRQNARIDQGIRNGQLTGREARRVLRSDARIHRQDVRFKHSSRGLTHARRVRLQHELNRNSRTIHRLKHNRRHQA